MRLVKLDSGDTINPQYVTRLGHRGESLKIQPEKSETLSLSNRDDEDWISITLADRERIEAAMGVFRRDDEFYFVRSGSGKPIEFIYDGIHYNLTKVDGEGSK
jgi:hypothetical protein